VANATKTIATREDITDESETEVHTGHSTMFSCFENRKSRTCSAPAMQRRRLSTQRYIMLMANRLSLASVARHLLASNSFAVFSLQSTCNVTEMARVHTNDSPTW